MKNIASIQIQKEQYTTRNVKKLIKFQTDHSGIKNNSNRLFVDTFVYS